MKHKGLKNNTSRGQIAELEEIIANILASVDHLQDISNLNKEDLKSIKELRKIRFELLNFYANKDINTDYHCIYKHLLLSRLQFKEFLHTLIDNSEFDKTFKLGRSFKLLNKILNYVRFKYLNLPLEKINEQDCMRCIEDYLKLKNKKGTA